MVSSAAVKRVLARCVVACALLFCGSVGAVALMWACAALDSTERD